MNKYKIIFDIFKNKILFVFKRCEYNNNKILTSKNLLFLSITLFIIVTRSFKFIIKNELNEDNFDMNYSKDILNNKKLISTLKTLKEKIIKKSDFIDIVEINVLIYYYLTRNKKNKLFFLIMNKIYDILYKPSLIKTIQKDNHISFNKLYSYDFENKYKKCYEFYTLKIA